MEIGVNKTRYNSRRQFKIYQCLKICFLHLMNQCPVYAIKSSNMNPNKIRELAAAFQKSRILLSGVELDIFTNIDEAGTISDQLANKLQLNKRACERLLNALVSLGFLTKKNHLFFNTAESSAFLSRKSPDYSGGLLHLNNLWLTWSQLTQVVKTGLPAHREEINERGEDWLFNFISAMHDRGKKQAPRQLAGIDLSGTNSILDVGGGSGAYSMEFISRKPEIEATIFDLPAVVPITKTFIDKEGFTEKIKTWSGDYTRDELPRGFDLVFLSAVLHSNSLEDNGALMKKCFSSLNNQGRIVIQDWVMDKDRVQPAGGAVFSINMLVGTEAGDCFTEQEVTGMLNDAGFENISRLEFETGLSQVIAQKILYDGSSL